MYDEKEYDGLYEDPVQAAFDENPAEFVAAVVENTVAQAAPLIQRELHSQVQQGQAEISEGLAGYALDQATRSMKAHYGDEWNKWSGQTIAYLGERQHLVPNSINPQHVLDAMDAAFLSARAEGERQERENEWNKIKGSGKKDYWEPSS